MLAQRVFNFFVHFKIWKEKMGMCLLVSICSIAFHFIYISGRFLVYRELSAIFDTQLFPSFLRPNSWAQKSWKTSSTFNRTLWTVKENFLVKKLSTQWCSTTSKYKKLNPDFLFWELSAILDAQLFPTFLRQNSWAPFSLLLRPTFYRTLWTVKVNLQVKKLGSVALN
jgi:hypothetical protein